VEDALLARRGCLDDADEALDYLQARSEGSHARKPDASSIRTRPFLRVSVCLRLRALAVSR
jgi:hypothetical protein